MKKSHFILSKLIPFWLMGQIVLAFGLLIARVIYGIVPQGNLGILFAFSSLYLLAILGFGLLISTFAHTQQQAMLMSFLFMMIFILMGGLYTSIDSMPQWAQTITLFNPVRYFIDVMRMLVMKGSGFWNLREHFAIIAVFAVVLNGLAVYNYKKRS